MQEKDGPLRRSNDDPYRVVVLHEEEPVPQQAFPTLKQQITRDLRRAGYGLLLTMGLLFAASILGTIGTTGSYWGDWTRYWDSYLPFHLGVLAAVFTLWSCIRALIAALMLRLRI